MITLIAAMDRCRVIGRDNDLPWHLPADLAHFKRETMGHPILMGRKTWEAIGRPLPGRDNIVLTRSRAFQAPGATVIHRLDDALELAEGRELMVIGGASLYRLFLSRADRMLLTEIDADVGGDTHFPEFDQSEWEAISRVPHAADGDNRFAYVFVEWRRRSSSSDS